MSVEPQALERSVLERKERDELAAIAEAMGVKTGSRTSKANLIGQILREAGIEAAEEKPKRAAKKTDASENGADEAKADKAEKTEKAEKDDDAPEPKASETQADSGKDS